MTIERGADWGERGALDVGAPVVSDDAALRRIVEDARIHDAAVPEVGLLGGDLCRTLGGRGDADRLRSPSAVRFRLDVVHVLADDEREHWFVAHLIARRPAWWGWSCAAMNAQFLGHWDLGPRAHPGDGLLDVTTGSLPLGDRLAARRRVASGTHLPHPALTTQRAASLEVVLPHRLPIRLDGIAEGHASRLRFDVQEDAIEVVV